MRRRSGLGVVAGLALLGCGGGDDPPDAPGATIRVAAASDLQSILPSLAERFGREAGVEVVPIFGSSGKLAAQVRQGAPYDVFLSADAEYVRALAAEGLVESGSVALYARGRLALVVAAEATGLVRGLDDLRRPEIRRVAIANPEVAPYGRAARQALERADVWEAVGPKAVLGETVRQALQFVETGNAEAGLVAHALAAGRPGLEVVEAEFEHDPIDQALGVVASTARPREARAFRDFLLSSEVRAALHEAGFALPPGPGGD